MEIDASRVRTADIIAILAVHSGFDAARIAADDAFYRAIVSRDAQELPELASEFEQHFAMLNLLLQSTVSVVISRAYAIGPCETFAPSGAPVSLGDVELNLSAMTKEQFLEVMEIVGQAAVHNAAATAALIERLKADAEPASLLTEKWRAALKEVSEGSSGAIVRVGASRPHPSKLN